MASQKVKARRYWQRKLSRQNKYHKPGPSEDEVISRRARIDAIFEYLKIAKHKPGVNQ